MTDLALRPSWSDLDDGIDTRYAASVARAKQLRDLQHLAAYVFAHEGLPVPQRVDGGNTHIVWRLRTDNGTSAGEAEVERRTVRLMLCPAEDDDPAGVWWSDPDNNRAVKVYSTRQDLETLAAHLKKDLAL